MNHSIHSADRATHLKIVVVALVAGIAVAGFGISARTTRITPRPPMSIKAGKPVVVTSSDTLDGPLRQSDFERAKRPPRAAFCCSTDALVGTVEPPLGATFLMFGSLSH